MLFQTSHAPKQHSALVENRFYGPFPTEIDLGRAIPCNLKECKLIRTTTTANPGLFTHTWLNPSMLTSAERQLRMNIRNCYLTASVKELTDQRDYRKSMANPISPRSKLEIAFFDELIQEATEHK